MERPGPGPQGDNQPTLMCELLDLSRWPELTQAEWAPDGSEDAFCGPLPGSQTVVIH